jgi:hypothetical protein
MYGGSNTRSRRLAVVAAAVCALGIVPMTSASASAGASPKSVATATTGQDVYVTPSKSLVLPGTLEIAAYERALALKQHPDSCPADPGYSYKNLAASKLSAVPSIYGDPGVYISIALTAGASATATFSGTTQSGVSVVIANASVTFGISFSYSITASVTYTGAWTVPTTVAHHGWLGAGAYADQYNWSYGQFVGCVWTVTHSGVVTSPYHLPYIWKGSN